MRSVQLKTPRCRPIPPAVADTAPNVKINRPFQDTERSTHAPLQRTH